MEKYAIPVAPIDASTKPVTGSRWKRIHSELNGKSERNYKHDVSPLLTQSYAEIREFPHEYHTWGSPCTTHHSQFSFAHTLDRLYAGPAPDNDTLNAAGFSVSQSILFRLGVSALEFDTKGTHLASVTRSGCLTVHKFESLCGQSNEFVIDRLKHFSLFDGKFDSISAVRWNPSKQDEIAYTSTRTRELTFFDIEHSQVNQVLRKRPPVTQELSDIAFMNDGMRVLASDTSGAINIWDRRVSDLPQRLLTTKKNTGLTSIQLLGDQIVYGASKTGFIYIWDLRRVRGGRSSAASQSDEVHSSPLTSVNLEFLVKESKPRKEEADVRPKELQTININPSCPYQLAFHLDDGWSGVVDMHNYRVSHIHCPRFPWWLDRHVFGFHVSSSRKPSWLPEHSIYAAPSTSNNGLHLLDFYPHPSSQFHVDYDDSESSSETVGHKKSLFVPLSKHVTVCAVHPLNGTIVAGTMNASLLTISQKHLCKKGDGDNDDDVEQS